MKLELQDSGVTTNPTLAQITEALHRLTPDGPDSFAILSRSDDDSIQTAFEGSQLVIEQTTPEPHYRFYRALRADRPADSAFSRDEAIAAFTAWFHESPHPDFLVWDNRDTDEGI